jgi:hypothetical protein
MILCLKGRFSEGVVKTWHESQQIGVNYKQKAKKEGENCLPVLVSTCRFLAGCVSSGKI